MLCVKITFATMLCFLLVFTDNHFCVGSFEALVQLKNRIYSGASMAPRCQGNKVSIFFVQLIIF